MGCGRVHKKRNEFSHDARKWCQNSHLPLDSDITDIVYLDQEIQSVSKEKTVKGENIMAKNNKQQTAQEIVHLMSNKGAYPGLWQGKAMTAAEVEAYVEENGFLPMANGHTKNSLEMQNVRHQVSRRVASLKQ